jgi:hypothetical protein
MEERTGRIRAPHLVGVPRINDETLAAFWAAPEPDSRTRRMIAVELVHCKQAINEARMRHYSDAGE